MHQCMLQGDNLDNILKEKDLMLVDTKWNVNQKRAPVVRKAKRTLDCIRKNVDNGSMKTILSFYLTLVRLHLKCKAKIYSIHIARQYL